MWLMGLIKVDSPLSVIRYYQHFRQNKLKLVMAVVYSTIHSRGKILSMDAGISSVSLLMVI